MLRSLDDNVWANLFNILFLYQVLVLTRCVSGRFVLIQPGVLYIIWIGACLSLGVNVHQQLVPLLYAFPIIVIFFLRGTYRQKIIRVFAFIAGYGGCSAVQDYFVFSAVSWTAIFSRCYHTPYHALFPHCWFFSSGSTIGAWIHKIGDGIRKSFYIDGGLMPCFLVVALISLTGAFLTIYRWYTRRTLRDAKEVATFALLACLTVVHLPHSFLYEPWSVERWDATYPGIIVLGATGYYAAMKEEAVSVLHVIRKMRFHILFCGIVCARLVHLLLWL